MLINNNQCFPVVWHREERKKTGMNKKIIIIASIVSALFLIAIVCAVAIAVDTNIKLSDLSDRVISIKYYISDIASDVTELKSDISSIETDIAWGGNDNNEEISDILDIVEELQADIATIKRDISSIYIKIGFR